MATAYSLKKQGELSLSPHFKVKEFVCKDGSDSVLIDHDLVSALETIRQHFMQPVMISSGYRTAAYNAKIGGAKASQHILGTAADIRITGVAPRTIAQIAEAVLLEIGIPGGVGLYEYSGANAGRSFCHVDVRQERARWLRTDPTGKDVNVQGFDSAAVVRPTLRKGDRGDAVKDLQRKLGITADGIFGPITENEVRSFQMKNALAADGIVGAKTWKALGY